MALERVNLRQITPEEERLIRQEVGQNLESQELTTASSPNNESFNFFKDGKFSQGQYNNRYHLERDSNTIQEVNLSRYSQIFIDTCFDNELIFTVHPEYYEDVTIKMERVSRPDLFSFSPINDRSGAMKGGTIRTSVHDLDQSEMVETQLAIQIDETKEWFNAIIRAEVCPPGDMDYLRVVYFKTDSAQINDRINLLTPQDKFIELTYPYREVNPSTEWFADIGDIIASPNSDWLIMSLYVFLQENRVGDNSDRKFEIEVDGLHANKINDIQVRLTPLQIQTEAISLASNQHIARFNVHLNVNYRYTQTNRFVYLFVKESKTQRYQVLKVDLQELIKDLKDRGGQF